VWDEGDELPVDNDLLAVAEVEGVVV